MRVLIVAGEYPSAFAGGIASVAKDLCTEFDKCRIEYSVVCPKRYEIAGRSGIFVGGGGVGPLYHVAFGLAFRKWLVNEGNRWDVVHYHLPSALGALLFAPVARHALATVHTTAEGFRKYLYGAMSYASLGKKDWVHKGGYARFLAFLEGLALGKIRNIVAVSEGVKKELVDWYAREGVEVVHNGIHMDFSPPDTTKRQPSNKPIVLQAGRLVAQKGILFGIEALAQVTADCHCLVAGIGPLHRKADRTSRNKGVSVEFLGAVPREQLYEVYRQAHILLMPSFYEGLPMVGIEGAASSLPLAAFQGARVNDIVCVENQRLICKTGDVKELGRVIEYLLRDSEARNRIGADNRERALDLFNSSRMAQEYIRIYHTL